MTTDFKVGETLFATLGGEHHIIRITSVGDFEYGVDSITIKRMLFSEHEQKVKRVKRTMGRNSNIADIAYVIAFPNNMDSAERLIKVLFG